MYLPAEPVSKVNAKGSASLFDVATLVDMELSLIETACGLFVAPNATL